MTLRSIATPTAPDDEEGEGKGEEQRGVEEPRRLGADHLLHHEGGVGPEHHHLAMGHVDDAHLAEGDGKADRREKEHRAEADAVDDVLQRRPTAPGAARSASTPGAAADLHALGRVGGQRAKQRCGVLVAALARESARRRCDPPPGVGLAEEDRRPGGLQRGARRGASVSRASAVSSAGRAAGSRDLKTACAALRRTAGSADEKRQRAEGRIEARGGRGC